MKAYFMWYLDFAYDTLGLPRPDEAKVTAFELLNVMS